MGYIYQKRETMLQKKLKTLKWDSYEEVLIGFKMMLEPFKEKMSGSGHIDLGKNHGAIYDEETSQMETFSRLVWAIGPYLSQNEDDFLKAEIHDSFVAGTEPESNHYFGKLENYSQKFVEMAALVTCLLLNKDTIWQDFNTKEKVNIANWLLQINERKIPKNNWCFFRILVNVTMKNLDMTYSQEMIDQDFAFVDSCYQGKGWYYDGKESQRDYYIPWAFHYYGLLVSKFLDPVEDAERIKKIRERATLFAQDFQYWFDRKGRAIPFGRSLTYRFAQGAFWSALVFANLEALPWEKIKELFSQHMQYWVHEEIFTEGGILTVGYSYQNLNIAEGYNAVGSPYWAFKVFILLAVDRQHPFWQVEKQLLQLSGRRFVSKEMQGWVEHSQYSEHIMFYPAGQFIENQSHAPAKYGKFVYSTQFGFSVPKGAYYYAEGAFDNTLALSEDGIYFRPHAQDDSFEILEDRLVHYWSPLQGVQIKTEIIPLGESHLRIHDIKTEKVLFIAEGGFSTKIEGSSVISDKMFGQINSPSGTSIIRGIKGYDEARIIRPEVNTNLLYSRSIFPSLQGKIQPGSHSLISMLSGVITPEKKINQADKKLLFSSKSI